MTAYPAKLTLENLSTFGAGDVLTLFPKIKGPLKSFTVMQDLEKGWVRIFGLGKEGYFSYRLVAFAREIILFVERCSEEGLFFDFEGETRHLQRKESLIIAKAAPLFSPLPLEKMHFGSSKKQDWSLVKRRLSLEEILPIWFQLGKQIPKQHLMLECGTARYLKICQEHITQKNRNHIGEAFLELFKMGFEGILAPRLVDTDYQSVFLDEKIPKEASSLFLLEQGARLIRKLLVDVQEKEIAILPCLPKEIHAGRFIGVECHAGLSMDLEWSKKLIRRLILYPRQDQAILLTFQRPIQSFRLRKGRKGRGQMISVGTSLELEKERLYILDRFQK